MNHPKINLQLPFKLDNYTAIKRFLDAVAPLFPEQTIDGQPYLYSKSSNYQFSIQEHSAFNKDYKGTEDFLNAIYRNESVELTSMIICNMEKNVSLALLNPLSLMLSAGKINVLEDYETRIMEVLGINAEQEKRQDVVKNAAFLAKHFGDMILNTKVFNDEMTTVIRERMAEIEGAVANNLPLSAIFLIGSTLEGVLSAVAQKYPREFNSAISAPKKDGKVLPLTDWVLGSLIDVACEVTVLGKDVKDFSGKIRDFRNYIHPNVQVKHGFSPTMDTVKISLQVLRAAVNEINLYCEHHTVTAR